MLCFAMPCFATETRGVTRSLMPMHARAGHKLEQSRGKEKKQRHSPCHALPTAGACPHGADAEAKPMDRATHRDSTCHAFPHAGMPARGMCRRKAREGRRASTSSKQTNVFFLLSMGSPHAQQRGRMIVLTALKGPHAEKGNLCATVAPSKAAHRP